MPNTAKLTLVTIEGEGLRFSATTGSQQSTLLDSGAGMIAPSPVEMLLVSLAACHAMDVISILRKKRQRVTAYELDARGDRCEDHPKRYTNIEIVHRLTGHDLAPEAIARAIELSHTRYCSVQACLSPEITVTNRFEIVSAGEAARTGD